MTLPQTDLSLPGVLPLVLRRTHLSGYRFGQWFGRSWASTLDERIELDPRRRRGLVARGRLPPRLPPAAAAGRTGRRPASRRGASASPARRRGQRGDHLSRHRSALRPDALVHRQPVQRVVRVLAQGDRGPQPQPGHIHTPPGRQPHGRHS
ncbi:DUF6531 domain-containing protein [Streptomyces pristinaespiralis]